MTYKYYDAIKTLQDILQINTVESTPLAGYPFGKGVGKCLQYCLNLFEKLGFKTKNVDGFCGWAEIGEGELFGILVHLDVVPEGEGWTYPPFGAVIDNGRIYARGTIDDKGPFVSCLYAVMQLIQKGYKLKKRLRFILGCDEESGWECMNRYIKTEEMPMSGIAPDADFPVINCEKGVVYHNLIFDIPKGIDDIYGGDRGNIVPPSAFCKAKSSDKIEKRADEINLSFSKENDNILLYAKGLSAHGSHPEKGDNALYKLFYCLGAEYEIFEELYHIFVKDPASIGLDLEDEKSGRLTYNLGTCQIKNKKIVCELDIRFPISYNKDDITKLLQKGLPCKAQRGLYHDPLYVDENHPLVETLLKAYDSAMGNETPSTPISIGGGTYARALPVGVAFGPVLPGMEAPMHEKDEFISLEHFDLLTKIYYKAIKEICFYDG
ncbi:MAG: Sapep family Mn(2+)-dependent dipeptidase [Bacillota bacterium]